jgi:hypothetical protein
VNAIPVKMCCHSAGGSPKFKAEVGDLVLVRVADQTIKELKQLGANALKYEDFTGESVEVAIGSIVAVYMP